MENLLMAVAPKPAAKQEAAPAKSAPNGERSDAFSKELNKASANDRKQADQDDVRKVRDRKSQNDVKDTDETRNAQKSEESERPEKTEKAGKAEESDKSNEDRQDASDEQKAGDDKSQDDAQTDQKGDTQDKQIPVKVTAENVVDFVPVVKTEGEGNAAHVVFKAALDAAEVDTTAESALKAGKQVVSAVKLSDLMVAQGEGAVEKVATAVAKASQAGPAFDVSAQETATESVKADAGAEVVKDTKAEAVNSGEKTKTAHPMHNQSAKDARATKAEVSADTVNAARTAEAVKEQSAQNVQNAEGMMKAQAAQSSDDVQAPEADTKDLKAKRAERSHAVSQAVGDEDGQNIAVDSKNQARVANIERNLFAQTDKKNEVFVSKIAVNAEGLATKTAANSTDAKAENVKADVSVDTQLGGLTTQKTQDVSFRARMQETQRIDIPRKIIDQIVQEVKLVKGVDNSEIMVRLNPPDLGHLKIQITQTSQGMTGHIHASSDSVKNLLQAHLPSLTQALGEAGVKIDNISISNQLSFNASAHDATKDNEANFFMGNGNRQNRSHNNNAEGDYAGNAHIFDDAAAHNAATAPGMTAHSWLA